MIKLLEWFLGDGIKKDFGKRKILIDIKKIKLTLLTVIFSSIFWWIYKRYIKCPAGFHTRINKDRPCLICSDKMF
jgi:hypothetical protein